MEHLLIEFASLFPNAFARRCSEFKRKIGFRLRSKVYSQTGIYFFIKFRM